jgi:hypothetical protein
MASQRITIPNLPQQIPPQTLQLLEPDGTMNRTWWLFLYNLSTQTLGEGSTISSIENLSDLDADIADTDSVGFGLEIANLQALQPLLQDPIPRAQPEGPVSVGASPFTYTAPFDGWMIITAISGATITSIQLERTAAYTVTGEVFPLAQFDEVIVTYTGTSTDIHMTFFPA